jgi:hypothetical protein
MHAVGTHPVIDPPTVAVMLEIAEKPYVPETSAWISLLSVTDDCLDAEFTQPVVTDTSKMAASPPAFPDL